MAVEVGIGGGKTARIEEPTRALFANNLNGAIQYTLSHTIYKVLEVMGGSLGAFAAGFLVQFLERLEPELVEILAPLIDWIAAMPELPDELRSILAKMRAPTAQADALLLNSLGTQAVSSMASSVLSSLLAPLTYWVNGIVRPTRPSPAEMHAALWRGKVGQPQVNLWLKELGWQDEMHTAFPEIMRPRMSEGALMSAMHREMLTGGNVDVEMTLRGYKLEDADKLRLLSYRILDEGSLLVALRREIITPDAWMRGMQHLGWSQTSVDTMQQLQWEIPGPGDLTRFMVRDVFNQAAVATYGYDEEFPEDYAKWMRQNGYKRDWALAFWRAKWDLPSLTVAYEMYHRDIISLDQLKYLLKVADYPPYWRDKLVQNAYTPFTRVDVRRMYGLKVLDVNGVYRSYRDLGYDHEKATAMTTFTIKYEDADGSNKQDKYRGMSYNLIEQAFRKDIITLTDARKQLTDIDMPSDDIEILLSLMTAKKQIDDVPEWGTEKSKDFANIIEQAYTRRLISSGEAQSLLSYAGMSQIVIEYTLAVADYNYAQALSNKAIKVIGDAYTNRAINRTQAAVAFGSLGLPAALQEAHLNEWDMDRDLRSKRLTASQYSKAYQSKLITLDKYIDCLAGLGYTDFDIDLLVKML